MQRIVQRQSTDVTISEEIVGSESVGVAGDGGDLGHGRAFAEDGGEKTPEPRDVGRQVERIWRCR